jgi:hypothetical protein
MISESLLDYEPKSIYFKKRWGAALAWVEAQNKDGGVGKRGGRQVISAGNRQGRRPVLSSVERPAQVLQVRGAVVEIAGEMP